MGFHMTKQTGPLLTARCSWGGALAARHHDLIAAVILCRCSGDWAALGSAKAKRSTKMEL